MLDLSASPKRLRRQLLRAATRKYVDPRGYARDPAAYCRDILGVHLTPDQESILAALAVPPFKALVSAGHNVGKSFVAACAVNWWYDSHDPGIVLTTAPTDRQVKDILWKEVRLLRQGSRLPRSGLDFAGPKVPRLESAPNHFAHGFTARDGSSFQGHHDAAVLIVFDEAVGVDRIFWEAAQPMLAGDSYAFLAIYNPTDQSSQAYVEERTGHYHRRRISCLDHPNIAAELAGNRPPYPNSIRLARLREMLEQWSTPVAGDPLPTDVKLGGTCYRPGPVAEARLLGRWPTQAVNSVWSEWVWDRAASTVLPDAGPLQIGCDVARFGDDFTSIHVRRGGSSRWHESWNGWTVPQVYERLKMLAIEWGQRLGVDPKRVPVAVDDSGVGGGVVDLGIINGWNFVGVNSAAVWSDDGLDYPNVRSALWFGVADAAARGGLSVAGLPESVRETLRSQLLSPTYCLDARGRRVVEPKDRTKERLRRSPDDADGFNLAYLDLGPGVERLSGRIGVAT